MRFAPDIPELALLLFGVILQAAGPDLFVFFEIAKVDVALSLHLARILVVLDLVAANDHLCVLDFCRNSRFTRELVDAAFHVLLIKPGLPGTDLDRSWRKSGRRSLRRWSLRRSANS